MQNAVAAAAELQQAMAALNVRHREIGLLELAVGIGINTGEAIVGTIGSRRRMKYTAVGKTINLAARIEADTVGGQILVSDTTLNPAGDLVVTGPGREIWMKGWKEPVRVYEVRGIGGEYGVELPHGEVEPSPLEHPRAAQVARIVNKRIERSETPISSPLVPNRPA